MVHKEGSMKYSGGIRQDLRFTAISVLLFEVLPSNSVIYLPKVGECGNADVRAAGCLRLHMHEHCGELLGAFDQM